MTPNVEHLRRRGNSVVSAGWKCFLVFEHETTKKHLRKSQLVAKADWGTETEV